MSSTRISINVLFYGPYPEYARRFFQQMLWLIPWGRSHIQDFRIGLNGINPGDPTWEIVTASAKRLVQEHNLPVLLYHTDVNRYKYPVMRRMFYGHREEEAIPAPGSKVLWCDDDICFTLEVDWWQRLLYESENASVAGHLHYMPMEPGRWEFIQDQPWYNPAVGTPPNFRGRPSFRFCQGSLWLADTQFLEKHNWPIPELCLNGGDQLLGELCRHAGVNMAHFKYGIKVNAAIGGAENSAPRRKSDRAKDPNLGKHYQPGSTCSMDHQLFKTEVAVMMPGQSETCYTLGIV